MKISFLAAVVAVVAFSSSGAAMADGVEAADGATAKIVRFASAGDSGVSVKTENGVNVYRGAPVKREKLAGAPAAPLARMVITRVKTIVEHHYHSRIRHLRTQGFYSGHCGKSRRFTQGFYSGPADLGGY